MTEGIRFGVNLMGTGTGEQFRAQVRSVAAAGADVVLVPDHLGLIGPAPALVAAAAEAPELRVGTFVLNAPFYSPALLTRDLATVDQLTGGRLEIGVGAGYVESEFVTAGISFGRPGQRVAHLETTVDHLRAAFDDPTASPPFAQPHPPIMIAGIGGRRTVRRDRTQRDRLRPRGGPRPGCVGAAAQVAERITYLNEVAGISYFTVIEPSAADLEALGEVIALVRAG